LVPTGTVTRRVTQRRTTYQFATEGRLAETAVDVHIVANAGSDFEITRWRVGSSEFAFVLARGASIRASVGGGGPEESHLSLAASAKAAPAARLLVIRAHGLPADSGASGHQIDASGPTPFDRPGRRRRT